MVGLVMAGFQLGSASGVMVSPVLMSQVGILGMSRFIWVFLY